MRDNLRSELDDFSKQLAGFKADLDDAEKQRKSDAQAEIADRGRYISGLRNDTQNLIRDFENGRRDMWNSMKAQLDDFTSGLARFRQDLVDGNRERMGAVRSELKEMGDNLRSQLGNFMDMLKHFKGDLDQAETDRKNQALQEIADRKQDLEGILGGTQDLLKAFGNGRREMWADLKGQLDAFTGELAQFKADLDQAEKDRQSTMGQEISDRRAHIDNLAGDTRRMIGDFETARKDMWQSMKQELDTFTNGLKQFKSDLEKGEQERLNTVVRDMKEKAEELKANLKNFTTDLSASVGQMLGELKKDRSEAARAWHEILSAVRSASGSLNLTTPEEPAEEPTPEAPVSTAEPAEEPAGVDEKPEPLETAEKDVPEEPAELEEPEEDRQEEIVSLLEENPEGLRMVEIAEKLGIENWRSLIPVMRELLDNGSVKKEESTYFSL